MENTTTQMYQDFTTKLLPKVAEGLVITKDYFIDLFGRYVKYLIMTDLVNAMIGILLIIASATFLRKFWRKAVDDAEDYEMWPMFFFFCFGLMLVTGTLMLFINVNRLVKDFYIPEIRVYEQISMMSNNK